MESSRKHTHKHTRILYIFLARAHLDIESFVVICLLFGPHCFFWASVCVRVPCRVVLYLCMTTKCWRHINLNLPKTGIKLTKTIWTNEKKLNRIGGKRRTHVKATENNRRPFIEMRWDVGPTRSRSSTLKWDMQSRKHFSSPQIDHQHDDDRWWAFGAAAVI